MKKNKRIINLMILTAIISSFLACQKDSFMQVTVYGKKANSIDFKSQEKIVYCDFLLESPPDDYLPAKEIKTFFVQDFSGIIQKKIDHIAVKGKTNKEQYENLKTVFSGGEDPLVITGKIGFEIKSRSRIEEVKNKEGKKEKKFIKIQHWSLKMKVSMTKLESGKEVFSGSFTEKMSNLEGTNPKYHFESLFYKMTEKFLNQISKRKRTERRYLLL